ncbi:MAG TPA: Imm51 family immunity protein [Urbifossiella sp.]|nr:Imm51 family immunity protein [Urbifossiella sp.]
MSDDDLRKLTHADWLAASDPYPLLDLLRARTRCRTDPRRLHLFAAACCREAWHLLTDERSRRGIEVAERYADGLASDAELSAAHAAAYAVALPQRKDPFKDAGWAVSFATMPDSAGCVYDKVAWALAKEVSKKKEVREAHRAATHARQADLVRDLFGNPFRPVKPDPAFQTPDLVALARAAYDDRVSPAGGLNPVRIAALADALEGVAPELAGHLRSGESHARGCWAVDAVLGREVSLPEGEPERTAPAPQVVSSSTEFAPFTMLETNPGSFSLLLSAFDRWAEAFEEAGHEGGGYGWHGVADALLRLKLPKLKKKVEFDPEASMFVAFGKDRDALAQLAKLMLEAMGDPAVLKDAIGKANPKLMG